MRTLFGWFILNYFLGCGTVGGNYYEEERISVLEEVDSVEVLAVDLYCVELDDDEYDNPQSAVVLERGEYNDTVGKCMTCQYIGSENFSSMDIPLDAIAACGGWFAGGGDYFYCIENNSKIEVYAGWQDEGQMEENDEGYHWEKTHSFNLYE